MKWPSLFSRLPRLKRTRSRWPLVIGLGIVLLALPVLFSSILFPNQSEAAWFDGAYGFRQRIALSQSNGTALTDYQVRVTLDTATLMTAGKLQSNCADLRFTDQSGKLLPYWIETGAYSCNNAATGIWVKVPNIPSSGGNIYYYYGNPQAQPSQDGSQVFPVFADFSTGSTLPTNWVKTDIGTSGTAAVGSGVLSLTNTNGEDVYENIYGGTHAYHNAVVSGDFVAQAQITSQTNNNDWSKAGLTVQNSVAAATSNGMGLLATTPANGVIFQHQASSATVAPNNNVSSGSYTFPTTLKLTKTGSTVAGHYSTNGTSWTQQGSTVSPTGIASNQYVTLFMTPHNTGATGTATFKYFFVRKYAASEPTASIQTEEIGAAPVAEWRFDEGQGQITQDSSSRNNDGTLGTNSNTGSDDPTWITEDQCVSGKCLKFDGSNDYVKSSPNSNLNTNFSLSGWVKSTVGSTWQTIYQSGTATNYWRVNIDSSNRLTFTKNAVADYFSTATLTPNQWNHIEIVKSGDSGTNLTFYINGVAAGTASVSTVVTPSGTAYIGATGSGIAGYVDEFKLYPYARSAAQVKEDFNRGASALGRTDQASLSNGLVGYWKMDEGAANTCSGGVNDSCDSSGNGHDAAWAGNTTFTSGRYGNGIYATNNAVQANVAHSTALNPSQITLSAWIKTSSSAYQAILFKLVNADPSYAGYSLVLGRTASNGAVEFWTGDLTGQWLKDTTNIADGRWHHVVATYDGTTASLYVDGVLKQSGARAANMSNTRPLNIGADGYNNLAYFGGTIDESRIYNRALSPVEVRALYTYAPSPLAYWKFDEGTGTTSVLDSSGNNYTGTMVGFSESNWESGKQSKSLNFASSSHYLNFGTGLNIGTSDFTLGTWFKTTETTGSQALFGDWNNSQAGYFINYQPGSNRFWVALKGPSGVQCLSGGADLFITVNGLNDGNWHYVAFAFARDSDIKMYLDGQLYTQVSQTTSCDMSNALSFNIGRRGASSTYTFIGSIDETKIYNYARMPAQILQDMAGEPAPNLSGNVLPDPLAHYKLDEQSGQTITNSAFGGSGYNGTLGANSSAASDDPVWKTSSNCRSNGCLSFDGTNRYARIAPTTALSTSTVSVSAWVYPTTTAADGYIVDSGTSNNQFSLIWYPTNSTYKGFAAHFGSGSTWATSSRVASINTWHHVVATTDGVTLKLYVDGELMSSVAANTATAPTVWEIGSTSVGDPFSGFIDEVKIFNTALTQDQVQLDMNAAGAVNFAATSPQESGGLSGGAGNPPIAVWEFDEKTGTSTKDTSGNSLAGTVNGALWTVGKIGSALELDGVDDTMTVANNAVLNPGSSDFTIETWVRGSSLANSDIIVGKTAGGGCSSSYGYSLGVFDSLYPTLHFCSTSGSHAKIQGATSLSNNQWYHLAVVVDRDSTNNTKMYVNGVAAPTTIANLTSHTGSVTNTESLTVGSESDQDGYFWQGVVDQVKIYNYARSPAQIAYDFNGGQPAAWWRLDECQGATLKDVSGNANNGTLTVGNSGSQSSIGNCSSSGTAWGNGATGKFNASLRFDGTDDFSSVSDPASGLLDAGTGDFSAGAWIKTSSTAKQAILVKGLAASGTNGAGWSIFKEDDGQLRFNLNDGTMLGYSFPSDLDDGNWHHVLVTFARSGVATGYVDGVAVGSTSISARSASVSNSASLYLGRFNDAAGYFAGQIDDARYYSYVLGADQVKQVFNGGAIRFGE